jgi:hypothetical protein
VHPNWTVAGFYLAFTLVTSAYTATRTLFKFRKRLAGAEPLPHEAVEVAPRPDPALILEAAYAVGIIAVLAALADVRWILEATAGLIAGGIAFQLVQPLAEERLVARWERSHGRFFRPADSEADDDDDAVELYVADRPVPAA